MDKKFIQLMKKTLGTILFLVIFQLFTQAQVLIKVADNYFRANPFTQEFSNFLRQLMNDPGLANKYLRKRTDTTLFSFMAEYKAFSPYTFLADRTEIKLFEKQVDIGDSTQVLDTVLIYQLLGYSNGKEGIEIVKKEFNKFHKRFQKDFVESQVSEIKKKDEIVGGMINYFVYGTTISPLSISWVKMDEYQNAFSILFRFKKEQNIAVLPVSADAR
jgi:hypothetical protein